MERVNDQVEVWVAEADKRHKTPLGRAELPVTPREIARAALGRLRGPMEEFWRAKTIADDATTLLREAKRVLLSAVSDRRLPEPVSLSTEAATVGPWRMTVTRPTYTPSVNGEVLLSELLWWNRQRGGSDEDAIATFLRVAKIKAVELNPGEWAKAINEEMATDELLLRSIVERAAPEPTIKVTKVDHGQ